MGVVRLLKPTEERMLHRSVPTSDTQQKMSRVRRVHTCWRWTGTTVQGTRSVTLTLVQARGETYPAATLRAPSSVSVVR